MNAPSNSINTSCSFILFYSQAAKTVAQQTALRAEIEHLRDQLQQLRDDREQEAITKGSKQNQDAVVRRLDNERQYLKSQLACEITLKNDLQEALTVCQTQLTETQVGTLLLIPFIM